MSSSKSDHSLESQVLAILEGKKRMKPEVLLKRLKTMGYDEKAVRRVIADLIDKNAVQFDTDWELERNPVWETVMA